MGILEETMQLKEQGMMDNEIAGSLRQRGYSPQEINDAINQSQIKQAVAGNQGKPPMQGMEPSIMNQDELPPPTPQPQQRYMSPQTREVSDPGMQQDLQEPGQEMYMPQNQAGFTDQAYAPEQAYYGQEGGDYGAEGSDTDTIIEVAEQVFAEKIKKMKKQTEGMTEFATLAQTKIENLSSRLKRIENTMDQMQTAILNKVGSYGKSLETTKKEMAMMQDSFRKLATKKHTTHKTTKKKTSKKK